MIYKGDTIVGTLTFFTGEGGKKQGIQLDAFRLEPTLLAYGLAHFLR